MSVTFTVKLQFRIFFFLGGGGCFDFPSWSSCIVQAANSQVKKLLGERSEWEAEVARAKEELRSRLQSQATQCELDSL